MKSTCVLPPLSDILHNYDYDYHQQDYFNQPLRRNSVTTYSNPNSRRPSSHSVLNVSNLLSSSTSCSSSEEEDYYDDCFINSNNNNNNSSSNLKAKRKRASPTQLSVLNRVFQQTFFPSTELRIELGKQLGMSPRTVQIWFQNKRQSIRTRTRSNSCISLSCSSSPPVSPYTKPASVVHLPPILHLPQPNPNQQQLNSWPLTPTCSNNSFDSSILFRD